VKGGGNGGGQRESQRASTSQQFVLAQVHPLDDVPAVVKHPPNVLCVYGTREMWIAVVLAIATCCADALQKHIQIISFVTLTNKIKENVLNNYFCSKC
jgi:hypothetical protein